MEVQPPSLGRSKACYAQERPKKLRRLGSSQLQTQAAKSQQQGRPAAQASASQQASANLQRPVTTAIQQQHVQPAAGALQQPSAPVPAAPTVTASLLLSAEAKPFQPQLIRLGKHRLQAAVQPKRKQSRTYRLVNPAVQTAATVQVSSHNSLDSMQSARKTCVRRTSMIKAGRFRLVRTSPHAQVKCWPAPVKIPSLAWSSAEKGIYGRAAPGEACVSLLLAMNDFVPSCPPGHAL